jgi:hypothetical protein
VSALRRIDLMMLLHALIRFARSPLALLYSFRAFVDKSLIPGAGLGAFIVFTGAKRLNEVSNERRLLMHKEMVPYQSKTMQPLQAYPEDDGSGVTVHLKGEMLHGNYNRDHRPKNSAKKLKAVMPEEVRYPPMRHDTRWWLNLDAIDGHDTNTHHLLLLL